MIEAHVSPELSDDAQGILRESAVETWTHPGGRHGAIVCGVIGAGRTGEAMDRLYEGLAKRGQLLVLVHPLDGVLPRPLASRRDETRSTVRSAAAVSREEVYANIADSAQLNTSYLAMVVLASVVAGIGLARDNTAAVIGAMVVAPLLGPIMALALGMVLGDTTLIRRASVTNGVGFALAVASAVVLGLALDADPATPELASRTQVAVWDLVLALAAGCAGALSYTTGVPTYLTGVMVAVALVPPAVASGILAAEGEFAGALAALLLAAGNVTALTLSAMLTFLWRGLRPRNWWQEESARRSARIGLGVFFALFAVLAVLVLIAERYLAS
jgi:uncharacterized hydrophobic protein (TIGR00341 family)